MSFELPKLQYAYDALEPYISEETLKFHHGKHHQAYVNKLNDLIKGTEFESVKLEEIIKNSEGGIFNNAAQVWNHTFYFNSFSPKPVLNQPVGELEKAINSEFGSFLEFQNAFNEASKTLFGSGWTWLVQAPGGKLKILQRPNAGNPITEGYIPIITCDVWEHAYYLDYQNRRPEYLENYWNILCWEKISTRFDNE